MTGSELSLGDAVEVIRNGLTVSNRNGIGGIPITRIETISDHSVDPQRVGYAGLELGAKDEWLLQCGDILFSHINSVSHLGKCALYEGTPEHLIHGMNLLMIRVKRELLLPRYFIRALRSHRVRTQIEKHIKPAVNQASVSISALRTVKIPVPPLPEQRRIADILDKADAIRRKRKEAIALTEELLRSAFLEMFGDPVTNPKGWEVRPLTAFGSVTTGNTPSRERQDYYGDNIEWIKSDNINTPSHILTHGIEGLSAAGKLVGRTVPAGSTLVTCIAGSPSCIGNVALADREVAFNQQINAVTPRTTTDHRFLYVMLLVGKGLIQKASTNSMKGMVSKGKMENVMFPYPPRQHQVTFGAIFDQMMGVTSRLFAAATEHELLFGSLVRRAFRGEL